MSLNRRTVLAALGTLAPFAFPALVRATPQRPEMRFRSFEDAVRAAFPTEAPSLVGSIRRIEVGHSDLIRSGVQGCHNDRPFAGHAAGRLRIVRTGTEAGLEVGGVRLYLATVDVMLTSDSIQHEPGRPLDFARLPAAPWLTGSDET